MVCSHCKVEKEENIIIAKIMPRYLMDPAGQVESLEMGFLIPKYGSGNITDDTPQHLPDDIGLVKQYDLIARPLKVERKARERKFVVRDYESIV